MVFKLLLLLVVVVVVVLLLLLCITLNNKFEKNNEMPKLMQTYIDSNYRIPVNIDFKHVINTERQKYTIKLIIN